MSASLSLWLGAMLALAGGLSLLPSPAVAQESEPSAHVERTVVLRADVSRRRDLMATAKDLLSTLPVALRGERTTRRVLISTLKKRRWNHNEVPVFVLEDEGLLELYVVDGVRDRVSRREFELSANGVDEVALEQIGQATLGQVEAILQGRDIGATVEETLVELEPPPAEPAPPPASEVVLAARSGYNLLSKGRGAFVHEGELGLGLHFGTTTVVGVEMVGAYGQGGQDAAEVQITTSLFRVGLRACGALGIVSWADLFLRVGAGAESETARGQSPDPAIASRAQSVWALYVDPQLGLALKFDPFRLDLSVGLRVGPARNYLLAATPSNEALAQSPLLRPFVGLGLSVASRI